MKVTFKQVAIFLVTIFTMWIFWGSGSTAQPTVISEKKTSWHEIAEKKRINIYQKIPEEWLLPPAVLEQGKKERKIAGSFIEGLLDRETFNITSRDPVEIAECIRAGHLTSVQVVTAFCKRAAFSHQLVGGLSPR